MNPAEADSHESQVRQPKIIGWYMTGMASLGAFLLGSIVVLMVVQVFARYVMNASLVWAEELCRYLLIWNTFLLIGVAYSRGELVTLDTIPSALGPRGRFYLRLAVSIPLIIFLWLMVTNCFDFFSRFTAQRAVAFDFIWQALGLGDNSHISIVWVFYSVGVGSGLLIIHIIVSLWLEGRSLFFESSSTRSIDA